MSNLQRILLLTILVYALVNRLPGIPWGLQIFDEYVGRSSRYHPDEFKIAVAAKNFPKDILSRTDLRYPTALPYLVGIVGFPINMATGKTIDDIQLFTLLGRLVSILFGVAGIYLTYELTRKFTTINAGLIAASLLSVSVYYTRISSVGTTDMATSFWALVVLLLTAKINPNSSWKAYILLGIVSGVLMGTKYSGAFALIPLGIWFTHEIFRAPTGPIRNKIISFLGIFSITTLIAFLLTTPSIVLHPEAFLSSLRYESERLAQRRSPLWHLSTFSYFFTSLTEAANLFICLTALLALLYITIKHPNIHLVAYAALILCFYTYFNTSLAIRYWTLVLPLICVLIAWSFERIISSQNKMLVFTGVILLVLCITTGIHQNYLLARLLLNDTRSNAAQFIEQLPQNSTFLVGPNSKEADGWQYPLITQALTTDNSKIPDYIILSEFADELPSDEIFNLQINNKNFAYRKIASFKPIEALKVEFLSPVIEVFQPNQ